MELKGGRARGEFHKFQIICFSLDGKEKVESRVFWLLVAMKRVRGGTGRILHHILNSHGRPKYLIEDCPDILIRGGDRAPVSMSCVLKSCMRNAPYNRGASTNPESPPLHLHSSLQVSLPIARLQAHVCLRHTVHPIRFLKSETVTVLYDNWQTQESRRGISAPYLTHKTGQQILGKLSGETARIPGMTLRVGHLGEDRVGCIILLKEWTLFILFTKLWVIINQQTPSIHMNHIYYSKPQVNPPFNVNIPGVFFPLGNKK